MSLTYLLLATVIVTYQGYLQGAIAFVDRQGKWLQYYPFRFGDMILHLDLPIIHTQAPYILYGRSRKT